jgi:hypothetical protein
MKKLFFVISVITLTGCSSLVHSYGEIADAQDPCQMKHKPQGHIKPDWCGAGRGYQQPLRIYNAQGQHIGTVK